MPRKYTTGKVWLVFFNEPGRPYDDATNGDEEFNSKDAALAFMNKRPDLDYQLLECKYIAIEPASVVKLWRITE